MDRRTFLTATGAVLVTTAGCVAHPEEKVCLTGESVTVEEVASDVATPLAAVRGDGVVELTADETERFPDVRGLSREVATDAIEGEGGRTVGVQVLEETPYVETDDGYHRIDQERAGETVVERWALRAAAVDSSALDADPVSFDQLDSPKRAYVRSAVMGGRRYESMADDVDDERRDEVVGRVDLEEPPRLADEEVQRRPYHPFFAHVFRETDADPEAVSLAPDPEPRYVEYVSEEVRRLEAARRTILEPVFEYDGVRVGTDPASFVAYYAVDLDDAGVSDEQRAVIERAVDSGYDPEEGELDSTEVAALLEQIDVEYVRLDGELYHLETTYGYEGTACF